MSYVDEMYNKGIEVKKGCYYSGINRITYYYRKSVNTGLEFPILSGIKFPGIAGLKFPT